MICLNPKVSIFFIAFLPQFVQEGSTMPLVWQMLVLGLVFMLVSFAIFCGVALLAGQLSPYLQQAKYQDAIRYLKAGVLGVLGLLLLW